MFCLLTFVGHFLSLMAGGGGGGCCYGLGFFGGGLFYLAIGLLIIGGLVLSLY